MTGFLLKLKSKNGQHVVNNLNPDTTIGILKAKISEITHIPEDVLHILIGFPPKPIDLSKNDSNLIASGISNGDILIIEEKQKSDVTTASSSLSSSSTSTIVQNTLEEDEKLARQLAAEEEEQNRLQDNTSDPEFMGILLKKVVPADNSCLFTSIGYVLSGQVNTDVGLSMRDLIAKEVANDPDTYNEGFLGKPNEEYCNWIKRSDSWGGAIEISIISNFYGIEIDVVDITNAIINRFGEDKNYGQRVFLLFDGIHYDPLYMESMVGGVPKTIFPLEEESVFIQAEQLAREAKSSRQFTDVNKFSLRCADCDKLFFGQTEAQKHAMETGHTNFGEV